MMYTPNRIKSKTREREKIGKKSDTLRHGLRTSVRMTAGTFRRRNHGQLAALLSHGASLHGRRLLSQGSWLHRVASWEPFARSSSVREERASARARRSLSAPPISARAVRSAVTLCYTVLNRTKLPSRVFTGYAECRRDEGTSCSSIDRVCAVEEKNSGKEGGRAEVGNPSTADVLFYCSLLLSFSLSLLLARTSSLFSPHLSLSLSISLQLPVALSSSHSLPSSLRPSLSLFLSSPRSRLFSFSRRSVGSLVDGRRAASRRGAVSKRTSNIERAAPPGDSPRGACVRVPVSRAAKNGHPYPVTVMCVAPVLCQVTVVVFVAVRVGSSLRVSCDCDRDCRAVTSARRRSSYCRHDVPRQHSLCLRDAVSPTLLIVIANRYH